MAARDKFGAMENLVADMLGDAVRGGDSIKDYYDTLREVHAIVVDEEIDLPQFTAVLLLKAGRVIWDAADRLDEFEYYDSAAEVIADASRPTQYRKEVQP